MEVSDVRRRVMASMERARAVVQERRHRNADAERAYLVFLEQIATPVVRQVANVLKVEKLDFTVFTPGGGLRLAADRGRDDFIELALETEGDVVQVVGRIRRTRGSRTVDETKAIKPGAAPDTLTEQDVLEFFATSLEPWLER